MMDMDLESLSLHELKSLQAKVKKAIDTFESRRKKEALTDLEGRARELGFSSLSELVGLPTQSRKPATPKYANPADPTDTWSGRGRKPRWFQEALDRGEAAESLAIQA